MDRRDAVRMMGAGAFTAMLPLGSAAIAAAEEATTNPGYAGKRIDVHGHYLPQFYKDALTEIGHERMRHGGLPDWSEESMLAMMDALSIERSIISVPSPGVHFGDDAAARILARQINEEGARLSRAHPDRIGFFASTPLPDTEGAVAETIHALDELGAEGLIFETNFNGVYLGDERLDPIYAEIDKRGAILFIHPTGPATSCGACSGDPKEDRLSIDLSMTWPPALIEYMFDTTRSVTNMVLGGVTERFPNIKILIPHAGATLPVLARRVDVIASMQGRGKMPSLRDAMKKFHFDLAGMPVPEMLSVLLQVADHSKIVYGSDYPFTPVPACKALANAIDTTTLLSPEMRDAMMLDNARALLTKTNGDLGQ